MALVMSKISALQLRTIVLAALAGNTPTAALARARPAWKSSIACTLAESL